jgi:predicted secreted protein
VRLRSWAVAAAALGLGASACAGTGSSGGSAAAPGGTRTVTAHDDGSTVALRTGQALVVSLPANASTGYHWVVVSDGQPALRPRGAVVYRAGTTGLVGAPGTALAAFDAVRTGTASVVLHYVSPGSDATVGRTFTLTVRVT